MEQTIVAAPMSRLDIRRKALVLRRQFDLDNTPYFPILPFIELVLPELFPGFTYIIDDDRAMGNLHGLTRPEENTIYFREDVYLGAFNGVGRDRFTVAHEVGHYLFHYPARIGHARLQPGAKLEAFRNPEWQADAFAGELLIPAHLAKNMSLPEIVRECGVSYEAANVQMKIMMSGK
jgi:hypothetical protein